ncbi:MAG: GspE/PulE family protein [Candidatus Moranbacteria bacterium]|nr:GspE/PulE family protein [Candidatus Moranbacteria bacterium]
MVQIVSKKIPKSVEKKEQAEKIIKRLSKRSEESQAQFMASSYLLPYIDLYIVPIDINDVRIIPEEDSKKYQVGAFYKSGKSVNVAVIDPLNNDTISYLEKLREEKGLGIKTYVVSLSSMKKIWQKYQTNPLLETVDMFSLNLSGKDLENFENKFADLIKLKERSDEIPTTEVINIIISGAVKMNASDIHFEPQKESVRMRYRIDGVLQDIGFFPHTLYKTIVSRVKMLGKMKLNIRDIAQDGHFSIEIKNGEEAERLDVRVSIIPGNNGESIVARLLSQSSAMVQVEELGLQGLANERMSVQISKPNGMILVTGPTGSGKTTTLYAFVNKLNHPEVKIITIEDPIEYQIKGISQTQIAADRGYTFEKGLRSIVRQDPDIILVGEIRDAETAEISVQAALTGHLVLSTLHTNNAVASVSRLTEMGVRPSLITSSVNAFVAQRLIRKLCPHCKEKYEPASETIDSIKKIISMISPKARVEIPKEIQYLYKPVGCPKCNGLGYKGRIGIFEILTITESIEKLILNMAGESELTEAALEEGMITMSQDGIVKTLQGLTSMEEVWRVTGKTTFLEDLYERLMDQSLSRSITVPETILEAVSKNTESFEKIDTHINSVSSKAITETIFGAALLLKAGDIHIEPEEEKVKIRFRINGILQTIAFLPLNEYPAFLGRIKLLSGLKTKIKAGVKDSRFSIKIEQPFDELKEGNVDVRVSIISGGHGETVVLRLLNQSATALDIESLGIRKQNIEKIIKELEKPYGIIINTGPTGSGKTTTLYSLLSILNKPEVKIITVEDPIEYQLKGILQTQVNKKAKYDFATALRALLRQNPDILMIGEIRDKETAEISIQAALTGHLLLSTLHANDTSSAPLRLINMGVRPDDLATAINAFIAQRLVRKLCPDCKKESAPTPEDKALIERIVKTISPKSGVVIPEKFHVYSPGGCVKCHNTGFIGRTTISEVLSIDSDIEELISRNTLSSEIKEKAIENGMITMTQDGILKVLEGETTLEEVKRVTEE